MSITFEVPNSVGERVHPDVDWNALSKDLHALGNDHRARLDLISKHLPGSGTISCAITNSFERETVELIQQDVSTILSDPANENKTGAELDLLGIPGMLCENPLHNLVANSSVLTPADLRTAQTVKAAGPAKFCIMYMTQPTKAGGYACLHFEGVLLPELAEDGENLAFTIAVAYGDDNPRSRTWLMDRFAVDDLGVAPLSSPFSRLFTPTEENIRVGLRSIVMALRRPDWPLTLIETLALEKQKYDKPLVDAPISRIAFPADCVAVFDLTAEEHSRVLQLEKLHELSVARGQVATPGIHSGHNSCGAIILSTLAYAAPRHFDRMDPHAMHLDVLSYTALRRAPELYLAKEPTRLYDFPDPARRAEKYKKVGSDEALEFMRKVIGSDEMYKLIIPGFSSWGRHYTTFQNKHPDPVARDVYGESLKVVARELSERAKGSQEEEGLVKRCL